MAYAVLHPDLSEPAGDWTPMESDAKVFTCLISKLNVQGVEIKLVWSLKIFEWLEYLRPVHGLIFIRKHLQYENPTGPVVTDPERLKKIYFAKQVIDNASATQAIINLLLNCVHADVVLGPVLSNLKDFSMSFDPQMRGQTISNSQRIRDAHNSVSETPNKEKDPFHYIVYMPIDGRLYELDGLHDGPIDHGPIAPQEDWLDAIQPIVRNRIDSYSAGNIRFNMMALVSDRKMIHEREMRKMLDEINILNEIYNMLLVRNANIQQTTEHERNNG